MTGMFKAHVVGSMLRSEGLADQLRECRAEVARDVLGG
jgi:hypothetical protein